MGSSVEDTRVSNQAHSCCCTGIRFCAYCKDSERVRQLFSGEVSLKPADTVIAKQQSDERTSSCSFALIGKSKYNLCIECFNVFRSTEFLKCCTDHDGIEMAPLQINGLYVFSDVISEDEEKEILQFVESPAPFPLWKESQSGRRKQEFGPRKNFKKRKVKPSDIAAMPKALKTVFEKISTYTERATKLPYQIAEASVLEYTSDNLSNFDPHIDDTWLWGDRIAGLNLLEQCAMTFVNSDGIAVDAYFPPRCFFLMSGQCRYVWMHGIRPESVKNRRISITLRELSKEIKDDEDMARPILCAASTFI